MPSSTPSSADASGEGLKIQEICRRLEIDYGDARYVLGKGVLPPGIERQPGKGNHRVFDYSQSFTLAIILKLRAIGLSTEAARKIAYWAKRVQGMAVHFGWDWGFVPFAGKLESPHQWFLDVGDGHWARIVTNANPGKVGLDIAPWTNMRTGKEDPHARPSILVRVDLVRIGQLLKGDDPPA